MDTSFAAGLDPVGGPQSVLNRAVISARASLGVR